ncbi:MAG: hypothetical protein FWE50_02040 [Alphaproteobacteria bacterium]|nr:hypothetical protein [Alphaproteobacteria bacterium]
MKNKFLLSLPFAFCLLPLSAHAAQFDAEDPLYFERARDLTLRGGLSFGDSILGINARASYGINDIFVVGVDIRGQQDFDSDRDWSGLSHVGVNVMYRLSDSTIKSDIFAGVKFAGNAEPSFSDTIYSAGFRLGRQWESITLAGLVKTSWIFDEVRGMAWINLVPEVYFRITENWRLGGWLDFQKVTDPNFDQTWLGLKVVRQYGRTQYVAFGQYEFNESEFRFGGRVNVVF